MYSVHGIHKVPENENLFTNRLLLNGGDDRIVFTARYCLTTLHSSTQHQQTPLRYHSLVKRWAESRSIVKSAVIWSIGFGKNMN